MVVFQLAFTFWKASLISIVERLLQSKLAGRFGSEADITHQIPHAKELSKLHIWLQGKALLRPQWNARVTFRFNQTNTLKGRL